MRETLPRWRGRGFTVGLVLAAVLVPATGHAHPGHEPVSGIMAGLMHPWTGLDHVAAMLSVGLWATRMHNPSRMALLGATVAGIVTGAFLGSYPDILTYGETITVVSVMALGLLAAMARDVRKPLAAILVALFSLFHGYVHTAETLHQSSQLAFSSGFLISMLALQLLGVVIGTALEAKRWRLPWPCLPSKFSGSHPC